MKNIFLVFLIVSVSLVEAQLPLSLEQAVQTALANSYNLKAAEQSVEIAKNNNNYERAGRFPNVNLSSTLNNTLTSQQNPASFISEATFLNSGLTVGADLGYTLWDGGRIEMTKRQLEVLEQQNEGNVKSVIEQTVQQVALAYQQVLIAEAQIDVIIEVLNLSSDRIDYAKIKQEFGQATTFDILQSKDAYLTDSTTLVNAILTFKNAMRNLNFAMGKDDLERQYELIDPLVATGFAQYNFEDLEQEALANNQSIKNLYTNLALNQANTNLQRTGLKPVVSLNAGISLNGGLFQLFGENQNTGEPFDLAESGTGRLFANVSATWNISNGGNVKRNIQNAKIQENITGLNIAQTKRNLSAQLATTLASYNNLLQLLNLNNKRISIAKENLTIAEERFRGGLINSFDYRSIQLAYINANQARLNTIFNLKNTEINLKLLTGGLVR